LLDGRQSPLQQLKNLPEISHALDWSVGFAPPRVAKHFVACFGADAIACTDWPSKWFGTNSEH
jgi:hypothetical protein